MQRYGLGESWGWFKLPWIKVKDGLKMTEAVKPPLRPSSIACDLASKIMITSLLLSRLFWFRSDDGVPIEVYMLCECTYLTW